MGHSFPYTLRIGLRSAIYQSTSLENLFAAHIYTLCIPVRLHARYIHTLCMQVILAFSRPFWPAEFFDVVCTGCFMPEFWVTEYPATSSDPATAGLCCITGFVAGAAAEEMSQLSQTTVVTRSLAQLDQIFGRSPSVWHA